MATVQPWTPIVNDRIWTEEEKQEWLAAHDSAPTHIVTFEPLYQIEVCIPPWEHPDRQIARSAVAWGEHMGRVFEDEQPGLAAVLAAHHEGNSLEVCAAITRRPRLNRVT